MEKHFYIVLLILCCFFMMPANASACGKKHDKSSCKKENVLKTEKKDCCDKGMHSGDGHHGCTGKCGHTTCITITTYSMIPYIDIDFIANNYFTRNKQKFHHSETNISSGFYSVWLPPKIK